MNTAFNTSIQPKPKVFSEQMVWRIKAVNRAIRDMKEMGYQPIDYDLEPNDMYGVRVQIRFLGSSFMRLLKDRSQRYEYDISNSKEKRCYVYFDDIVVWWKELS